MMDTLPWTSFLGGLLLGLSAVFLFVIHGKVAGISGIINGLLSPVKGDRLWRVLFLVGLTAGGLACLVILDIQVPDTTSIPIHTLILAGLLVGFGTRLANGCTSGHGICGIGRFSVRSVVATCVFMLFAMATVWLTYEIQL
ncbi:YeeE/YedE family protein [Vibrio sp.]|uniref:YeeE/YedE family protein n=1 Tax=Vibrio sp. TaxID=678 RepID=UPI0035304D9E